MLGLVPAPCLIVKGAELRHDIQVVFTGVIVDFFSFTSFPAGDVVSFDDGSVSVLCFHPC